MSCGEQALSIADILRDHMGGLHLDHEQGTRDGRDFEALVRYMMRPPMRPLRRREKIPRPPPLCAQPLASPA